MTQKTMTRKLIFQIHLWNVLWILISCQNKINLQIVEETAVETEVGNILSRLPLNLRLSSDLNFISDSQFFKVSNQGMLIIRKVIDLETLCDTDKICCGVLVCKIEFSVLINNKQREVVGNIDIDIEVLDKNDHSPKFQNIKQIVTFSEFAQIGSIVNLIPAIDGDLTANNRIRSYQLTEKSNTFSLDLSKLPTIALMLGKRLDYENENEYQAELKACDQELCANQTLIIQVRDENDNSPVFDIQKYSFSIFENTTVGSPVDRVRAVDRDSGKYGELRYSISAESDSDLRNTFSLVPTTGEIVLRQPLSTKSRMEYTFRIAARDSDPVNPKQAFCTVDITIIDLNNHEPNIKIIFGAEPGSDIYIEENKAAHTLFTLKVTDDDKGDNAVFQCQLGEQSQRLFELTGSSEFFSVKSRTAFDHEQVQRLEIIVLCRDNGQPSLQSRKIIPVIITDVNEFHPQFQFPSNLGLYKGEIQENSLAGSKVIQVRAIDNDKSAQVRYQLDNYGLEYFTIDQRSGLISCNKNQLDREHLATMSFSVVVTDALTDPINSATAQIKIRIIDVNDNPPMFARDLPQFSVIENSPASRLPGRIVAHDEDEGDNARVTFSLKSAWNAHTLLPSPGYFNVLSSGYIETLVKLDREKCDLYILEVVARDNPPALNSLSATTNISLRILDENDCRPQWTSVGMDNNMSYYNVTDALRVGDHFTRVTATDEDTGSNGQVRYRIKQQQHLAQLDTSNTDYLYYFQMNATSGQLTITRKLLPGIIQLVVEAIDLGQPPLQSQMEMVVYVTSASLYGEAGSSLLSSGLNTTIIAIMISITALVSFFLIIAIFCVRRRPPHPPLHDCGGSSMLMVMAKDTNGNCTTSLSGNDWLTNPNEIPLDQNEICGISSNGIKSHGFLPLINNNNASAGCSEDNSVYRGATYMPYPYPSSNNQYHQLQSFAPTHCLTYEPIDGDSGDSGKGPSEEGSSNIHHLTQDGSGNYFSLRAPLRHQTSSFRPLQTDHPVTHPNPYPYCYILSEDANTLPNTEYPNLIAPSSPGLTHPSANPLMYCTTSYNSLTLPHANNRNNAPSTIINNTHNTPTIPTTISSNSQCSTPKITTKLTPMHLKTISK